MADKHVKNYITNQNQNMKTIIHFLRCGGKYNFFRTSTNIIYGIIHRRLKS
jgi:hypothetical protein